MQLPHSKVRQTYVDKIKIIESNLKDATSSERNEALLRQVQTRLDSLAETYQYSEEVGTARYKMYELQALVHYFNGDDDDALDFINQAIETRGDNYAKAQKLKARLLEQSTTQQNTDEHPDKNLSKSDRRIADVRQAVQSAGLWSIVSGVVLLLVGLTVFFSAGAGSSGNGPLIAGLLIIAASIYLFFSGYTLNKCESDDNTTKRLLVANIVISVLTFWSVFPLATFITSSIALGKVRRLDGKFETAMREYDKIAARIRRFQNKHSIFFYRSPTAVAILTVATFGTYSIYWAYKHWALIGKSTKESTHPVLSGIFVVFTIYPLMKRIKAGAVSHGYKKFQNAGWAALGFIMLIILSNSLGTVDITTTPEALWYVIFSIVLSAGAGAVMAGAQRAANAHNTVVLGKGYEFKAAYTGEIIVSVLGILLVALAVWGSFLPVEDSGGSTRSNPAIDAAYQRTEVLRSAYDDCNYDLELRRDAVNIYSDYEVNSFNRDLEACEDTRHELNAAIDEYNRLAGFDQT